MTESPVTDAVLGFSGWLTLALAMGPFEPVRVAAVFIFVFFCPGTALVRLTHLTGRLERNVTSIALSLSLATVVSEVLSIFHVFSADRSIVILSMVTTLSVLTRRVHQRAHAEPVSPESH